MPPYPDGELLWLVVHAMEDLDRSGVFPSGDRVCAAVGDFPEPAVRRARREALARRMVRVRTRDDRPHPAPDPDDDDVLEPPGGDAGGPVRRPVPAAAADEKAFNTALWRIAHGRRGLYRNLAVVTGLTVDGIKGRVKRVNCDPPEDDADAELEEETLRYLRRRWADSADPAVREFLGAHRPQVRAHPDNRRFRSRGAAPPPA